MKRFPKLRRAKKWLLLGSLLLAVLTVCGCQTLKFYSQAMRGQYQIFANQEPIEKLIAHPKTPAELKTQLELVQKIRAFAEHELKLPVDGHYRKYVDVGRPYVVWNVQAARRFSLEPRTWWYPLVGRLEYRGYFSEAGARDYAALLRNKGNDVYVGGVDAYSTLGWFKDPVLNTFIHRDEAELAEVIFHELAHQRLFARGDTDFNEAFATVVGQEGARRWLRLKGDPAVYDEYLASVRRNAQFVQLVLSARAKLETLYGDTRDKDGKIKAAENPPLPDAELQRGKERILSELRDDYEKTKAAWGGSGEYDAWFAREINNAQLNTIANYYALLPGFERLLELNEGDLEKFYEAAERLSKKSKDERREWLKILPAEPNE